MRISLVSEHASPLTALGGEDAGGQNVHVARLAAGLAARGHDVVVHTRRDHRDAPRHVTTPQGYVVDHVDAGPARPIPKDRIADHLDQLADELAGRWRAEPPDLVHAHFWMSGVASVAAARSLTQPPPLVETFHALGVVKQRHQGAADTSPAGRIDAERALLQDVDHVVATSTDEIYELRALGLPEGHATVVPCGVDTGQFVPGDAPSAVGRRWRLVTVGRLVPRKGYDTVIRALAALPHTELVVIGGPPRAGLSADPEVRRLREVAASYGVADRVTFTGAVPPDEVARLLPRFDLLITAAWYEPFGIVPVEAMACGLPVVATDVGGHRDTVDPGVTGELVPSREPAALAAVIADLLNDPERRRRYGATARRRAVEHYDWHTVVERTEAVYRSLVNRVDRSAEAVGS
jgi:glycosyltransferase involved in cell wall biosynthesis